MSDATQRKKGNPPFSFWSMFSSAPAWLGLLSGNLTTGGWAARSWWMVGVGLVFGVMAITINCIVYERFIRHG